MRRTHRLARFSGGLIGVVSTLALAIPAAGASGIGSDGAPTPTPTTSSPAPATSPITATPVSPGARTPTIAPSTPARTSGRVSGGTSGVARNGGLQSDGAPSAPSIGTPTLTVTPSTNLTPGQLVTVSGSGFAPSTPQDFGVQLIECRAPATSFTDCGTNGIGFGASPDSLGAFTTEVNVARTLQTPSGPVRCDMTPTTCVLAAFSFPPFPQVPSFPSFTPVATAALVFDPSVPVPHPTVTVSPASGILAGQSLAVTGSGFAAGHDLNVFQCAAGEFCFSNSESPVQVASNGTFSTALTASLRTTVNESDLSNCLVVACEVRVEDNIDPEYTATTAIAFDPSQPPPPTPTITVTPSTGLHHDQAVTVAGQGFDPQADVEISQCGPNSFGFCGDYLTDLVAGADGTFSASVKVSRLVSTFDIGPNGPTPPTAVDCATSACSVSANEYSAGGGSLVASAPVAFDGSVPPPALPTVTAAPLTNLPNRATVTVHGSGFSAGESVFAEECISGVLFGTCDGFSDAVADSNGDVVLTVPVRRTAGGFAGEPPLDCVDAGALCQITVSGERSYERFNFTLRFDPNAPVPPPPSLTVTPSTGLGYRQSVAAHGAGFSPNATVELGQCAAPSSNGSSCAGFTEATTDAAGTFDVTTTVRRILASPFGPGSTDCAVTQCTLVAEEFDGFIDSASANLGFDPNSVAPPPPVLKASPDDGLHDGDTVDVRGSKFTPNSDIVVLECAGEVDPNSNLNCDFSSPARLRTDDRGRFSGSTQVHSAVSNGFDGSNGLSGSIGSRSSSPSSAFGSPTECAVEPCRLVAFNISDPSEFASASIEFDVPELEVDNVSVREGTGGVTPAPVPVSLSEASSSPVTIEWHAQAGSASAADFTTAAGTLVIPAGATSGVIPAEVVADAVDESTERFTVVVDSATGVRIGDGTATVKIKDDDAKPSVSVGDAAVGEAGGAALVPVRLSVASGRAVTVEFRTHHGSARSRRDFTRTRGVVTFAPGQTEVFAMVAITDDAEREATETFRVELDDADHAEIAQDSATVTILDND